MSTHLSCLSLAVRLLTVNSLPNNLLPPHHHMKARHRNPILPEGGLNVRCPAKGYLLSTSDSEEHFSSYTQLNWDLNALYTKSHTAHENITFFVFLSQDSNMQCVYFKTISDNGLMRRSSSWAYEWVYNTWMHVTIHSFSMTAHTNTFPDAGCMTDVKTAHCSPLGALNTRKAGTYSPLICWWNNIAGLGRRAAHTHLKTPIISCERNGMPKSLITVCMLSFFKGEHFKCKLPLLLMERDFRSVYLCVSRN